MRYRLFALFRFRNDDPMHRCPFTGNIFSERGRMGTSFKAGLPAFYRRLVFRIIIPKLTHTAAVTDSHTTGEVSPVFGTLSYSLSEEDPEGAGCC